MQNSENIDTKIFGLTSTLEKPTRGKPVREGFVLFMSFQEILLQHIHLQIFTQTYLDIHVALLLDF
jgi:hypothetical protein